MQAKPKTNLGVWTIVGTNTGLGWSNIVGTNTGLGWSNLHYRFVIVLCGIAVSVLKHKMW